MCTGDLLLSRIKRAHLGNKFLSVYFLIKKKTKFPPHSPYPFIHPRPRWSDALGSPLRSLGCPSRGSHAPKHLPGRPPMSAATMTAVFLCGGSPCAAGTTAVLDWSLASEPRLSAWTSYHFPCSVEQYGLPRPHTEWMGAGHCGR
jgi:hypothetical protein